MKERIGLTIIKTCSHGTNSRDCASRTEGTTESSERIYFEDSVSHRKFVQNIFSVLEKNSSQFR